MDIRKLQRAIVDGLEDVKAQNIAVFNTEHLTPLFERVVVASGTSNRQTRALAASVRDAVKGIGLPPPRTEGEVNGEWIIVDCGAAVVHVMQPSIRDYYHLEELWGEKPVKMKLGGAPAAKTGAKKAAAEAALKTAETTPPQKADATQSVGRTSRVKAATPARGAAAGKSPPSKKVAAKKTAARQAGVTRTVGVKSGAARKTTARTRPTATATAGKMPARKTAARKTAARKTAARKTPAQR